VGVCVNRIGTVQPNGGVPITRNMGVGLTLPPIPAYDVSLVRENKRRAYIVTVVSYIDTKTPQGYVWITQVCAKITKLFTEFQSCPSHNGFFYSDTKLTQIH
jgi:hypothetical protein